MISQTHSVKGYVLLEKIGEGSFGEVFLAKDLNGNRVALKIVKPLNEGEKNRERNALDFYIRTKEKNRKGIIEILDCGRTESGAVFYTMPLAEKTLQDLINEKLQSGTWFALEEMRMMFSYLFDALEFLETEHLVHRDIKPTNILLVDNKLVLSDIGLLEIEDDGASRYGTENYRAPEYFKGNPDFWSLSCVMFFILTGQSPEFWQSASNWKSPLGEEKMLRKEIREYARLRSVIFNRATSHRAIDLFRSAKEFKEEILDITSSQNRKFLQKKYFAFAVVLMILLCAIFLKIFERKNTQESAQIASVAKTKSPTQIKELNAYALNQISANGTVTAQGEAILSFASWRNEMLKTENRIDFAKQILKLIITTADPFNLTNKDLKNYKFRHLNKNDDAFNFLEKQRKFYANRKIENYSAYVNSIFYSDKNSLISPKNFSQNKIKIYPLTYKEFLENRKNLAQFGYKEVVKKMPQSEQKTQDETLLMLSKNLERKHKQVDELVEKYSNEKGYAEYLKMLKSEIAKIPELEFAE